MKLPQPLQQQLLQLLANLLELTDEAAASERALLDAFGESNETLGDLDALSSVRVAAQDGFRSLSNTMNALSVLEERCAGDTMKVLQQSYTRLEQRVPAFRRSIEEIRLTWGLP